MLHQPHQANNPLKSIDFFEGSIPTPKFYFCLTHWTVFSFFQLLKYNIFHTFNSNKSKHPILMATFLIIPPLILQIWLISLFINFILIFHQKFYPTSHKSYNTIIKLGEEPSFIIKKMYLCSLVNYFTSWKRQ